MMKTVSNRLNDAKALGIFLLGCILFLHGFMTPVQGAKNTIKIEGVAYEFDEDSHYEFNSDDELTTVDDTYGTLTISGFVSDESELDDITSYEVSDGELTLYYTYGDKLLNDVEDSWHLVDDKSKQIADFSLDSNIMKGAIVIQTSNDRENWVEVCTITNAFEEEPERSDPIYSTTDIQLINGSYYRVVIAYELGIRTEERSFLFFNFDEYDYKKYAEVYEFYAYIDSGESTIDDSENVYSIGSTTKVTSADGYSDTTSIGSSDVHDDWDIGNFYVTGYTEQIRNADGDTIFLKDGEDEITLWFKLTEDINKLRGDSDLVVVDVEGSDDYFNIQTTDFEKGALIIQYTNENGMMYDPVVYTNFLEADAKLDTYTKIQLFGEGDYAIALDYAISSTSSFFSSSASYYRIYFEMSVRNGDCVIYPVEVETGNDLINSSMTESGFTLDLDKSRYVKMSISREVLNDEGTELVEDTNFDSTIEDGIEYTEEGIYTITVENQYTNQTATKRIYVGTNNVLRAYMASDYTIEEINELVKDGAVITEEGVILKDGEEIVKDESDNTESSTGNKLILVVSVVLIAAVFAAGVILTIKRRRKSEQNENKK